ncbi:hypothetical protein AWENTII_007488 [Aspergillus wentii]|nr:hypothetical protein MW887_011306 [Aspergillus wentii]
MSQSGLSSVAWGTGERGGRRKKVFDYLKAANELRQSYTSQWTPRNAYDEEYFSTPGAFPDVEIARSGDEEMVLFPSYGRKLIKNRQDPEMHIRRRRDSISTIDEYLGESEDRRDGWEEEEYQDPNAIVDVDVRGWIYAPHRGPMTRKHRLMIALARKLSGVPAPSTNSTDNGESSSADYGSEEKMTGKGEEEIVNKEMQSILKKGETGDLALKPSVSSTTTDASQLSKDELSVANAHLMERLRPFLTNPMAEMPVTVFFFNDKDSQSRNTVTDESGHFNLRAGLTFVPTHIRVLASENLSAAKEIEVSEPNGISLISDIDDTVKHSAIASGAKEIFRNTFVRELAELTVDGVTDWYSRLSKMGVDFHYVSNAPWQLYPLLERYFKMVGLPPGSFHLKQYSGMLQGIFEPTAERKKGSLERILRDFPERKFILIGDSGEADLEVYTDIVLANPGRILGIFIRDVTTPDPKKFFEKSVDYPEPAASRSRSTPQLADHSDSVSNRPVLPPRRPCGPGRAPTDTQTIDNADLIDLRDEGDQTNTSTEKPKPRPPPSKPSKPSSLRAVSTTPEFADIKESLSQNQEAGPRRKPAPPLPRRRTSPNKPGVALDQDQGSSDVSFYPNNASGPNGTYTDTVKSAVQSVSNALPAAADYLPLRPKTGQNTAGPQSSEARSAQSKQPPPPPPPRRSNTGASTSVSTPSSDSNRPESQRQQQSYPVAAVSGALQYASDRLNWAPSPSNTLRPTASNLSLSRTSTNDQEYGQRYSNTSAPPAPLPNRREELWRRRWERASEILEERGVLLSSWRVGSDAQDVSVWLVEGAMKQIRKNQEGNGK